MAKFGQFCWAERVNEIIPLKQPKNGKLLLVKAKIAINIAGRSPKKSPFSVYTSNLHSFTVLKRLVRLEPSIQGLYTGGKKRSGFVRTDIVLQYWLCIGKVVIPCIGKVFIPCIGKVVIPSRDF